MLNPYEFTVGTIADAVGLTWVRPITAHDEEFLVIPDGDGLMAVMLDPRREFEAWECSDATNHKGMLVSDIQIEVDEETAFDTERTYAPHGAVVRQNDTLKIAAAVRDDHRIRRQQFFPLASGLPASGSATGVGFLRWQITLGDGDARKILKTVEVEPASGPPR